MRRYGSAYGPPTRSGSRRILVSSDGTAHWRRPHVDLVGDPIAAGDARRSRTADGALHDADVVVLATGFQPEVFLAPTKVFGRDGRELSETWQHGAAAHLGVTVPGFPNLFLMHGPHTALRAGSAVHMIECQARYVRQAIHRIAAGVRTLEVRRRSRTRSPPRCGNAPPTAPHRVARHHA